NDLQCTFTDCTLSIPMQVSLEIASGGQFADEYVGTGDNFTTSFTHTVAHPGVKAGSVTISAATVFATDDGAGNLTGTGIASGSTINYTTGVFTIVYSTAPVGAVTITIDYVSTGPSGVWIKKLVGPNEIDSTDGMAPVATISDSNSGWTTQSSYLGTPQYNPGQAALAFFKNSSNLTTTVPQPGDIVHVEYQAAGASIARVQDTTSVDAEALAWGDNGVRSITQNSISPIPRTSQEAELAAQAVLNDSSWQHYEGKYTCYNQFSVTAELMSGTILTFTNLPSGMPSVQAELITKVVSTYLSQVKGNVKEYIQFDITFGQLVTTAGVLAQFAQQTDVFQPQDTAQIPLAIDISTIGLSTVADVQSPTFVSWDTDNFYYNTNVAAPSGGGF